MSVNDILTMDIMLNDKMSVVSQESSISDCVDNGVWLSIENRASTIKTCMYLIILLLAPLLTRRVMRDYVQFHPPRFAS